MDEDQAAIARVLSGATDAFRVLVERHQRLVWTFCRNLLRNAADADDVCQDVFTAAFVKLATFDARRAKFSTWLLTIAHNRCCNVLQARSEYAVVDGEVPGDDQRPESDLVQREVWQELDRALAQLPLEQRTAFVLAEIQELPYAEIAVIEGVELGTVKSRVSRAKDKLRHVLRAWQPENREHSRRSGVKP
jgi:RNA polymerase sigma-70 factor (ECF subfamily)